MKKRNHKQYIKQLCSSIGICFLLLLIVGFMSYTIFQTDFLEPKVDELTTSYISFNNKNATDMLKISNIKVMSNQKGESLLNDRYAKFQVSGAKGEYQVLLYPLTNTIDSEYLHFYLDKEETYLTGTLDSLEETEDGGIILYSGNLEEKEEKFLLRMWIDKKYKGNSNHTSFEIKIKSR